MTNKKVLAVYLILLSMFSVITAIQWQGMLFLYLIIARQRRERILLNAAQQYNIAIARLLYVQRRISRPRRFRRKHGRTEQWWKNLIEGRRLDSEWTILG